MSKLKEYINLAKDGLPNIDKIVDGIINQGKDRLNLLPEDEKEEVIRRKLICHSCPFFSLNLVNDDSEYRKLFNKPFETKRSNERFCGVCGCPEDTKTYSLSASCGLEVYNNSHPDNQQPLKWEAFK